MLAFKIVPLVLLLVNRAIAQNDSLNQLIKRVHSERITTSCHFINFESDFLGIFLRSNPQIPVLIWNDPNISPFEFTNAIFVVRVLEQETIYNNTLVDELIGKLRNRRDVIVLAGSLINLEEIFLYFAENKFTRIMGKATEDNDDDNMYGYFPYADVKVQRISPHGPLPQPLKDLNGFTFVTSIMNDYPRMFTFRDNQKQRKITGTNGQLFLSFLRKHNATFRQLSNSRSNASLTMADIERATVANEIDISMNAYVPQPSCGWSYPIKVLTCVMMVPVNGFVDQQEYFVRPFSPGVWICIGLYLIFVTVLKVLLNKFLEKCPEYWISFSQTLTAMLLISPERSITTNVRLHSQVYMFAFLIGNIYAIFFTSFMTVFIKIKQFDTMQDLIDNNVKILTTDFDKNHFINTGVYPKSFLDLMVPVDRRSYGQAVLSMTNTSYAYIVANDKRDFVMNIKAAWSIEPVFRTARETLNFYFISYLLPPHSPFKDILDEFIIGCLETGLSYKWDDDLVLELLRHGFKMRTYTKPESNSLKHVSLNLGHLKFAWMIYVIGLILGGLVFIGEHFCDKIVTI